MKPLNKFLNTLTAKARSYKWIGHQKTDGLLGTFISFVTHTNGFEIIITEHDYRDKQYPFNDRVLSRRGLPGTVNNWIEITAKDNTVRFGRKVIINRWIIRPKDEEYDKASFLFQAIMKKAKLFKPNMGNRLSSDQSIMALCKAL